MICPIRTLQVLCALVLVAPLSAQLSLATTMQGGNPIGSGSQNTHYLDITAKTGVSITAFDLNTNSTVGTLGTIDIWMTPDGGTYVGYELSSAVWTRVATAEPVVSAGSNQPSNCTLQNAIGLLPGRYGIAIVYNTIIPVSTTMGSVQTYGDTNLQLDTGSISADPFQPTLYSPRIWNGTVYYSLGQSLLANFSAQPTYGTSPISVQFTDLSNSSAPGGVTSWNWDFDNDGVIDSTLREPAFAYAGGIWSVALTVTDRTHLPHTKVALDYILVDQVVASFVSQNNSPTVQFTDTSTGGATNWGWDFDNNGVVDSILQHPSWVYATPGVHVVRLRVANALSSAMVEQIITLSSIAMPSFDRTFSHATQTCGYWFVAPVAFTITGVLVPDETGHGVQSVAVIRCTQTGQVTSYDLLFESASQPSNQVQACQASFDIGDTVIVLGACGDASMMHNSYGTGGPSTVLGQAIAVQRVTYRSNLVASPLTGTSATFRLSTGNIGRVETAVSDKAAIDYGIGTDAGYGNGAPELTTALLPAIAQVAELSLTTYDPGMVNAAILIGFGRGPIPTPVGAIHIGTIYIDAPVTGATGAGTTKFLVPIPNNPSLIGGPTNFQAITLEPGAPNIFGMSNGVEWFIGAW